MQLLDFEIDIKCSDTAGYQAEVVRSPAGESEPQSFALPFSSLELENQILNLQNALLRAGSQRRRVLSEEATVAQDFGQVLFDILLSDEIGALYHESKREAFHQGAGLRIKLHIGPAELAALPWEFLYDSREGEYICLSRSTPLVRYLDLASPIRPLAITPPLRIIAMVASPADLEPLNVQVERQRLHRALDRLEAQGFVKLDWLDGQTWQDLQEALYRDEYHIFHFVGHGFFDESKEEGFVVFVDDDGRSRHFSATDLARMLADQNSLRLCVLNSCEGATSGAHDSFSSTAATLVHRGIPAVIAMQYDITDEAAIQMAESFYAALAGGLPVDAALAEARKGISFALPGSLEWGTPVLFMRADDGRIFDIDASALPEADAGPVVSTALPSKETQSPRSTPTAEQFEEPGTARTESTGVSIPDTKRTQQAPNLGRKAAMLILSAVVLIAVVGMGFYWLRPTAPDPPPSPTQIVATVAPVQLTAPRRGAVPAGDVEVLGMSEPGASLEILISQTVVGTAEADNAGNWSFMVQALQPGDLDIAARSVDENGQVVSMTDPVRLSVQAPPPPTPSFTPEPTSPPTSTPPLPPTLTAASVSLRLMMPQEGAVPSGEVRIIGVGEPGDLVEVSVNKRIVGSIKVDDIGNWSYTIRATQPGIIEVGARTVDKEGQVVSEADPVRLFVQVPPPATYTTTPQSTTAPDTATLTLTSTPSPTLTLPAWERFVEAELEDLPDFHCDALLKGGFSDLWCGSGRISRKIGTPRTTEVRVPSTVGQAFSNGLMLWLDAWNGHPKQIYVLDNLSEEWSQHEDLWSESQQEDACPDTQPLAGGAKPLHGFGRVWCTDTNIRQNLGPALGEESQINNVVIQEFEHGIMLWLDTWNDHSAQILALYE